MKRVLIITYYWPPAGGGGVMRWLKMSKYLPEWGFVRHSKMTAGEVRRDFIHSHAIVLQALWALGRSALRTAPLAAVAVVTFILYLMGVNEFHNRHGTQQEK